MTEVEGLTYIDDFLTEDEERQLLDAIEPLDFREIGAPARMRFQRTVKGERDTAAVELAPRSAYVLAGKARWSWQHSEPAGKELRYSVTFRTLKRSG